MKYYIGLLVIFLIGCQASSSRERISLKDEYCLPKGSSDVILVDDYHVKFKFEDQWFLVTQKYNHPGLIYNVTPIKGL